jgi:hypothetical protein
MHGLCGTRQRSADIFIELKSLHKVEHHAIDHAVHTQALDISTCGLSFQGVAVSFKFGADLHCVGPSGHLAETGHVLLCCLVMHGMRLGTCLQCMSYAERLLLCGMCRENSSAQANWSLRTTDASTSNTTQR